MLLLQARDLGRGERRRRELGERWPSPELQRRAHLRGRILASSGRQRPASVGDLALEALGVKLARTHPQAVTGRCGDQHARVVERLAQRATYTCTVLAARGGASSPHSATARRSALTD